VLALLEEGKIVERKVKEMLLRSAYSKRVYCIRAKTE
jgi:hypothetical protein